MFDHRQLYTYDYRRPRYNNKTYTSSGVLGSMNYLKDSPQMPKSTYDERNQSIINSSLPSTYNSRINSLKRQQRGSKLSNYAQKNLSFNDKQIHQQNTTNIDIITKQEKKYDQSIKQYPRFSVQDKDHFYYKKLFGRQPQSEISNQEKKRNKIDLDEKNFYGKNTFKPEQKIQRLDYQTGRRFQPKMLNHADQVSHLLIS